MTGFRARCIVDGRETMKSANQNEQVALARRLRLADLSSSLGAGVLGVGIGVVAAGYLQGLGLPILGAGALLHGWGMADKHRLQAKGGAPGVWWSTLLYWICWAGLAALAVYVVWRRFR